jgi:hypothetical protein
MLPILNHADRLRKVSLERVDNESLFKMKPENMVDESASMKDNFAIVPTLNLPDDV